MPSLSTHVLDLYSGHPAEDVKIDVHFQAPNSDWVLLHSVTTNKDGRVAQQIITEQNWQPGQYELVFHIGDYFSRQQIPLPDPSFLTTIPVRFTLHPDAAHYHIPLLVSPWGYQIYRGS